MSDRDKGHNGLVSWATRQPFAAAGGVGLVSILSLIVALPQGVEVIVGGIRAVSEPLWGLVFGWLPFELPVWTGDYFTMGLILVGAYTRLGFHQIDRDGVAPWGLFMQTFLHVRTKTTLLILEIVTIPYMLVAWPLGFIRNLFGLREFIIHYSKFEPEARSMTLGLWIVYLEVIFYAILVIVGFAAYSAVT